MTTKHKKMKKIFLFLAVAALMSLTACQKDGVYKPGKKLAEMQSNYNGGAYTTEMLFHWDGKKLTSITIPDADGDIEVVMTYDGKQLVEMCASTVETEDGANITNEMKVLFEYDGRRLCKVSEIEAYTVTVMGQTIYSECDTAVYNVEHDGKHISKIIDTEDADWNDMANSKFHKLVLNMLMPKNVANHVLAQEKRAAKSSAQYVYTISYTWDGDNVSSAVANSTMMVDGAVVNGETQTTNYTYDNKKNPLHGFMMDFESVLCWSENNVLTETEVYGSRTNTASYTYEYEGKYPTLCICTETHEGGYTSTDGTKFIYE